jgi:hypothetical protein
MGSEMQPQIMRAQKSEEILIFEIIKTFDMFSNIKALFSIIRVYSWFIGSAIAHTQHIFLFWPRNCFLLIL